MIRILAIALMAGILAAPSCPIDMSPAASCGRTQGPIPLYVDLNLVGEPVATVAAETNVEIIKRHPAEPPTTHFLIKTAAGATGWFARAGADFRPTGGRPCY